MTSNDFPSGIDADALCAFVLESGLEDEDRIEFLAAYAEEAPKLLAALRAAIDAGSPPAVASAAHAFKSPASLICARRLAALLGDVEETARHGGINHVATLDAIEAEAGIIGRAIVAGS
jgi:HPt (histidine-containing phosphotransfer) domain-containing protein